MLRKEKEEYKLLYEKIKEFWVVSKAGLSNRKIILIIITLCNEKLWESGIEEHNLPTSS